MDVMIRQFFDHLFGSSILSDATLGTQELQQIIVSLMAIVFSHRYVKGDKFITEAQNLSNTDPEAYQIDFSIIRDVMYKYSKKAQDRFFSFPIESFLFAAFSLSDEGLNFLKSKPDNNDDEKLRRLHDDLGQLKK